MDVVNEKILVVDGDLTLRHLLATRLTTLDYQVVLASDGIRALDLVFNEHPDLVLLDIILPKLDGYEVCRKIRSRSTVPIIILTSLGNVSDRVKGLTVGADDYIIKPFSPKELELRIQLILNRPHKSPQKPFELKQKNFNIGPLVVDLDNRVVFKNGIKINLTVIEFCLLDLLVTNSESETGLSRITILKNIWGYAPEREVDLRIVDVNIARLRAKLEHEPHNPEIILTVRGLGYRLQK